MPLTAKNVKIEDDLFTFSTSTAQNERFFATFARRKT